MFSIILCLGLMNVVMAGQYCNYQSTLFEINDGRRGKTLKTFPSDAEPRAECPNQCIVDGVRGRVVLNGNEMDAWFINSGCDINNVCSVEFGDVTEAMVDGFVPSELRTSILSFKGKFYCCNGDDCDKNYIESKEGLSEEAKLLKTEKHELKSFKNNGASPLKAKNSVDEREVMNSLISTAITAVVAYFVM